MYNSFIYFLHCFGEVVHGLELKLGRTGIHHLVIHPQLIEDNVDGVEAVSVTHDAHDPLGAVPGLLVALRPRQGPVKTFAQVSQVK